MKVGLNCLGIDPDYAGGVSSYTFGLIDGISESEWGELQFVIFTSSINYHLFEKYREKQFEIIKIEDYDSQLKRKFLWQTVKINSKLLYSFLSKLFYSDLAKQFDDHVNVLYTPTTVLFPFHTKCKQVLSMHDIQQVHYPEFFDKTEVKNRRITYNLSAELADKMQVSSQFIKRDFLAYFKTLKEKQIEVIPEGVEIELFKRDRETEFLFEKYSIPKNFLFFPAQLWHHKNHITVFKALKILKSKGVEIPLVLTGAKYSASQPLFDYLKDNDLDNVYYLGKVPFSDLLALYKAARFLITAVLYESSSIPILEAAAAGTSIIASKTPPNEELAKNLNISLFEPTNSEELAGIIERIWDDGVLQSFQREFNNQGIKKYSWKSAAEKYIQLFKNMV